MSILKDVDPAIQIGFLRTRGFSIGRLSDAGIGNSKCENRDATANRGRRNGRLLYWPALFQTGFQVLGLCAQTRPALEYRATGHVDRKTKTRARSRATEVRVRQQLRIQTLRFL